MMHKVIKRFSIILLGISFVISGCTSKQPDTRTVPVQANEQVIPVNSGLTNEHEIPIIPDTPIGESQLKKYAFASQSLGKNMSMTVYMPKGYSKNTKYPVLYFLHGYTSNPDIELGEQRIRMIDKLIGEGKIHPLIVVAPQYDNSFGLNSASEVKQYGDHPKDAFFQGMYEDYLYKDVIQYVDKHFNTLATRENRYVGGISMGGASALHLAFKHPDLFSKAAGHSPALFLDEYIYPPFREMFYPTEELRKTRDPISLAQSLDLNGLKVYLDCGEQDELHTATEHLYEILQSKGAHAKLSITPGGHDGSYWDGKYEEYLMFYAGN